MLTIQLIFCHLRQILETNNENYIVKERNTFFGESVLCAWYIIPQVTFPNLSINRFSKGMMFQFQGKSFKRKTAGSVSDCRFPLLRPSLIPLKLCWVSPPLEERNYSVKLFLIQVFASSLCVKHCACILRILKITLKVHYCFQLLLFQMCSNMY